MGSENIANKTISVVMTIYNEPMEYIRLAVQSILSQTYQNIEFIVVIDNPIHFEAIEYIKSIDSICLLVNEKNIGLPASLNRGIGVATGTIIARMDSDDISMPQRIEKEYEYLCTLKYDLVSTNVAFIDERGTELPKSFRLPKSQCEFQNRIKYECCAVHPTYMFKKKLYEDCGGYKESLRSAQDYEFIYNAYKHNFKIGFLDEKLLRYRINSNGITSKNKIFQRFVTYYIQRAYTKGDGFSEDYIKSCLDGKLPDFRTFSKEVEDYQNEMDKGRTFNKIFVVLKYAVKSSYVKHILFYGLMKRQSIWFFSCFHKRR